MADSPIGIKSPNTLASDQTTGLQTKAWMRSKVYMESLQSDIYMKNANLIEPLVLKSQKEDLKVNSDKMVIKITKGKEVTGSDISVTIAMQQAIDDVAVNGNDTAYIGQESTIRHKQTTAYANDFARPVAGWGFGIDKLNQEWLSVDKNKKRLLTQWRSETKGLHYRQALCETISENLEAAPLDLIPAINPNLAFAETGVVTYDSTLADYQSAIAGVSITPAENHLTVGRVIELSDIAEQDKYIKPLMINGEPMYKLVIAPEEKRLMLDSQATGSYASDYISGSALARVKEIVPEALLVIGNIILCEDVRNPTFIASSATWGYLGQGKSSSRAAAGVGVHNVNVLCGAEAVMDYERDMIDFREQKDDYGRYLGTLIRETSGVTLPIFDKDTKTDASAQYEGSMLVLTSRESDIGR